MWGPRERSLLSLCKHRTADFMPLLHKNPKDIATSWLMFLLPWTISTLEPKDLGCAIASWARLFPVHVCLLRINRSQLSLFWLVPQSCGYNRCDLVPTTPPSPLWSHELSTTHTSVHRLQPRSSLLPEEELGGRGHTGPKEWKCNPVEIGSVTNWLDHQHLALFSWFRWVATPPSVYIRADFAELSHPSAWLSPKACFSLAFPEEGARAREVECPVHYVSTVSKALSRNPF